MVEGVFAAVEPQDHCKRAMSSRQSKITALIDRVKDASLPFELRYGAAMEVTAMEWKRRNHLPDEVSWPTAQSMSNIRKKYCAVCGNEFESNQPNALYCSQACRRTRYIKPPRDKKPCIVCGVMFDPISDLHLVCGPKCRAIRQGKNQKRWREARIVDMQNMNFSKKSSNVRALH